MTVGGALNLAKADGDSQARKMLIDGRFDIGSNYEGDWPPSVVFHPSLPGFLGSACGLNPSNPDILVRGACAGSLRGGC
jgi:hypothetical protein